MFFEHREYRINEGQRERFVRLMEEKVIPFQVSKGVVIVGSFVAMDDPNLYVWMRRFDSEKEAERLYKEIYDSDYWKTEVGPEVSEMLDRESIRVTRLEATPRSVIR